MKLSDILKILKDELYDFKELTEDIEINKATVSSLSVDKTALFFAVKGSNRDGHDFIDDVFAKGVPAVIGEKALDISNYYRVKDVRKAAAKIMPEIYGNPQKKMSFIGITGTNGKTTTSYIMDHILGSEIKTGLIGTVQYKFADKIVKAPNTTPFIWDWYDLLYNMNISGVKTVVSEISSHALAQDRIKGTMFDVAVFTNFTRDHIDFHENEENYFSAKKKLFTSYFKESGFAVINIDDAKGCELLESLKGKKCITYSMKKNNADLHVVSYDYNLEGSEGILNFKGKEYPFKFRLPGEFNIYNMMAAILAVTPFISFKKALKLAGEKVFVPGRLEKVGEKGRFYIDYAHTPDALENVIKTLIPLKMGGKIITVFGAGGDRDKGKRPLMGKIASELSDFIIVTDDNPRTENPDMIIKDILSGIDTNDICVERDRKSAIAKAVKISRKNDIVLVAGKGHEDYQIIGTVKHHFSDRETILELLGENNDK